MAKKLKLKTQTTKRFLQIWINKKFVTKEKSNNGEYFILKASGKEICLPLTAVLTEQKETKTITDDAGKETKIKIAPEDRQILVSLKGDFEYGIKGTNEVVIGADLNEYLWELKKMHADKQTELESKDAESLT